MDPEKNSINSRYQMEDYGSTVDDKAHFIEEDSLVRADSLLSTEILLYKLYYIYCTRREWLWKFSPLNLVVALYIFPTS